MNRREMLQASVAALSAAALPGPWPVEKIPLGEPLDLWWDDWPEGKGDTEYDLLSPLLLNMDTSLFGFTDVRGEKPGQSTVEGCYVTTPAPPKPSE